MGTCTGLGTPAHFMLMTLKATAGICGQRGQGGVGALLVWGDWCLCHALPWAGGNPAGVPAAQAHSVVNNKGRHHQYEKNRILAIYPPTPASLVLSKILLSEKWKGSTPLKKREGGEIQFSVFTEATAMYHTMTSTYCQNNVFCESTPTPGVTQQHAKLGTLSRGAAGINTRAGLGEGQQKRLLSNLYSPWENASHSATTIIMYKICWTRSPLPR